MNKKLVIVIGVAVVLLLAVVTGVIMFKKTDWYMFSDDSGELNIMKLDDSIASNTQKINFAEEEKMIRILYFRNGKCIGRKGNGCIFTKWQGY